MTAGGGGSKAGLFAVSSATATLGGCTLTRCRSRDAPPAPRFARQLRLLSLLGPPRPRLPAMACSRGRGQRAADRNWPRSLDARWAHTRPRRSLPPVSLAWQVPVPHRRRPLRQRHRDHIRAAPGKSNQPRRARYSLRRRIGCAGRPAAAGALIRTLSPLRLYTLLVRASPAGSSDCVRPPLLFRSVAAFTFLIGHCLCALLQQFEAEAANPRILCNPHRFISVAYVAGGRRRKRCCWRRSRPTGPALT